MTPQTQKTQDNDLNLLNIEAGKKPLNEWRKIDYHKDFYYPQE